MNIFKKSIMVCITIFAMLISFVPINVSAAKTYSSYKKVIAKEKNSDNPDRCYYNYIKLKTKKGTKKMLVLTRVMGAYMCSTEIFVPKGKKVTKGYDMGGSIESYSKDRKYILIYSYAGSGIGAFSIYKYNSKKGKYVEKAIETFDRFNESNNEAKALKRIEKQAKVNTSKFQSFKWYKGVIRDYN